jgi:hypothetical protein
VQSACCNGVTMRIWCTQLSCYSGESTALIKPTQSAHKKWIFIVLIIEMLDLCRGNPNSIRNFTKGHPLFIGLPETWNIMLKINFKFLDKLSCDRHSFFAFAPLRNIDRDCLIFTLFRWYFFILLLIGFSEQLLYFTGKFYSIIFFKHLIIQLVCLISRISVGDWFIINNFLLLFCLLHVLIISLIFIIMKWIALYLYLASILLFILIRFVMSWFLIDFLFFRIQFTDRILTWTLLIF